MLKKIVLKPLSFFLNILLFFNNLLIIFYNLHLIIKADILIFQNIRIGFGNIFTSIDLARKLFEKKKILFINFYDETRHHNKKIFDFLSEQKIIFYTSIYIKFINKKFGEYERHDPQYRNFFQYHLIQLISLLNKTAKKYTIPQLYKFAENKIKNLRNKKYKFLLPNCKFFTYYYYLVEKKPYLKINRNNLLIKNLIENSDHKTICIYKREKKFVNKYTRNYSLFIKIIRILYLKKYKIYLAGEYTNLIKCYPEIKKLVTLPETNSIFNKDLNLAFQIISNYYIGDCGGGSFFSMYKKKSIILGKSIGLKYPDKVKTFDYKIFKKNIKDNKRFKKLINEEMLIYKHPVDPYLLHKLKFKFRIDNNKVIKYIKNHF